MATGDDDDGDGATGDEVDDDGDGTMGDGDDEMSKTTSVGMFIL